MVTKVSTFPKRLLIDADALVSHANSRDSGYKWAKKWSQLLLETSCLVYLSNFAFGEALTVISMRLGIEQAMMVAESMRQSDMIIVDIGKRQRKRALTWFAKQNTKNARFTDCVNMALMEELGIEYVFSRDRHYKKNGFRRLGID